jgi:hypothetical protein
VGKYSYGIDKGVCQDAVDKGVTNFNFEDSVFVEHMRDSNHENHARIHAFLTHLALCHTVVVETKEG